MLFYDFGETLQLTSQARSTITQAAENAREALREGKLRSITISAHVDSGFRTSNAQVFTEARAADIREELVGRSVPRLLIRAIGLGTSQPLVQTPDGVREPQNRRVEIVLCTR